MISRTDVGYSSCLSSPPAFCIRLVFFGVFISFLFPLLFIVSFLHVKDFFTEKFFTLVDILTTCTTVLVQHQLTYKSWFSIPTRQLPFSQCFWTQATWHIPVLMIVEPWPWLKLLSMAKPVENALLPKRRLRILNFLHYNSPSKAAWSSSQIGL